MGKRLRTDLDFQIYQNGPHALKEIPERNCISLFCSLVGHCLILEAMVKPHLLMIELEIVSSQAWVFSPLKKINFKWLLFSLCYLPNTVLQWNRIQSITAGTLNIPLQASLRFLLLNKVHKVAINRNTAIPQFIYLF